MSSLPTTRDLPRLADGLRNTADWLDQIAPAVLSAHSVPRADSDDDHRVPESFNEIRDPTGGSVGAIADDRLHFAQLEIRGLLGELDLTLERLIGQLSKWHATLEVAPRKPTGNNGPTPCAERYCEDPADTKCAGRCEACYRWRKRWLKDHPGDVAPNVPRDIIDQRQATREKRKMRVDPTTNEVLDANVGGGA